MIPARLARRALAWTGVSTALHLGWEILQLPLYGLWQESDSRAMAFAVAHCTAGDAIISICLFLIAALALGDPDWPMRQVRLGGGIVIAAGVAYTALSEWRNVQVLGAWSYSPAMPLVLGVGAAPLAQWIVVPVATILLLRHGATE